MPVVPNLLCPCCGCVGLRPSRLPVREHLDELELHCARCAVLVRPARLEDAPPPACDRELFAEDADTDTPDPKWWWLGLVLMDDGAYLPVALAGTVAGCWALLDDWPGQGRLDRLCLPVLPPGQEKADARERAEKTLDKIKVKHKPPRA